MSKIVLRTEINFKIWGITGFSEWPIYFYNYTLQVELLHL